MTDNIQTQDILKQIASDFGRQIFDKSESRRLEGILSDYITDDKALLKLLRLAVRDGIVHELLQCDALDEAAKKMKINTLKHRFKENNNLEESRAYFAVDCFAYALGLITVIPDVNSDNSIQKYGEADNIDRDLVQTELKEEIANRLLHEIEKTKKKKRLKRLRKTILAVLSVCIVFAAIVITFDRYKLMDIFRAYRNKERKYVINENFKPVMSKGKWGYVDRGDNKVIPFIYDTVWHFNQHIQDLAMVKLNDKCYYIDTTGTRWKYEEVGDVFEGLAPVMLNGKCGYIDRNKNEVIPFIYDEAWNFNQELQGLALVKLNGKGHYIDTKGKRWKYDEAYSLEEGLAPVMLNNKWGYIDKNRKEVIPCKYEDARSFNQELYGLAWIKSDGKGHYIDTKGNRWKYDEAYSFTGGLAPVMLNGKWGYIDKTCYEVIPLKYDTVMHFNQSSQSLAKVRLNGQWGYIDRTGKEIVPCRYSEAQLSGELSKVKSNNTGSVPETTEEKVGSNKKYEYTWNFYEGLAKVRFNGKWGYIDKSKNEIIPVQYDYAWDFNQGLKGLALVKLNDKYYYIDTKGDRWKYDEAYDFTENLAPVMLDGKWGYIDRNRNEVIPCKYDEVKYFSKGLARVRLNDKWFFIDKTGKYVKDV
jgi:hypothetical protein